jgi:hypothetical protein
MKERGMVTMTEQKPRKKTKDQVEADAEEARQSASRTRPYPTIPLPAGVDMSRSTSPAGAIVVEVPFRHSTKYAQREVYLALPQAQAATLRSIQEALEERHAKLDNGRMVQSPQDGLKWMLEEVERAASRVK